MSIVLPHRAIEGASKTDNPKKYIVDTVGDLKSVQIMSNMVLLGIYFRPEKTKGGVYIPQTNIDEDAFQGKVGLMLKWGTDAFIDPEDGSLYEERVEIGEWCVFKVGDAWSIEINKYPCRLVRDTSIKMKVKDPSIVF